MTEEINRDKELVTLIAYRLAQDLKANGLDVPDNILERHTRVVIRQLIAGLDMWEWIAATGNLDPRIIYEARID